MTAKIKLNAASGGGSVSIQAPSSSSNNRVMTLPDTADGKILTDTYKPVFFARNNNTQSISNGVSTKVEYDSEVFDSHGYYDHTTNYRFTPLIAGYYHITANAQINATTAVRGFDIKKNGSRYVNVDAHDDSTGAQSCFISSLIPFNGSSDYVEIFIYQTSGSSKNLSNGSQYSISEFSGYFVRAL